MLTCLDRFSGVLSVLWMVGAHLLLTRIPASPHGLIVFFGLFEVSLLLAIAGLRRGSRFSKFCSVCTIISVTGFTFLVTEPFHNIIRKTKNLFRKDEYANLYYGAPECDMNVSIQGAADVDRFKEAIRQFAKREGIGECKQKHYRSYSGPPRPAFKGAHVAI
jgi:hypothetical protein